MFPAGSYWGVTQFVPTLAVMSAISLKYCIVPPRLGTVRWEPGVRYRHAMLTRAIHMKVLLIIRLRLFILAPCDARHDKGGSHRKHPLKDDMNRYWSGRDCCPQLWPSGCHRAVTQYIQ